MPKYSINTEHNGHEWIATFDDYDGAPDSPSRSVMGKAGDEVDAIMDLLTEDWETAKIPIVVERDLPCPICHGIEGCDHAIPERQRAACDEGAIHGLKLYERATEFLQAFEQSTGYGTSCTPLHIHMARFAAQILRERGTELLNAVKGGEAKIPIVVERPDTLSEPNEGQRGDTPYVPS